MRIPDVRIGDLRNGLGNGAGPGEGGGGTPQPPAGYVWLVDSDGAQMMDSDGAWLMDRAS